MEPPCPLHSFTPQNHTHTHTQTHSEVKRKKKMNAGGQFSLSQLNPNVVCTTEHPRNMFRTIKTYLSSMRKKKEKEESKKAKAKNLLGTTHTYTHSLSNPRISIQQKHNFLLC
jgi:hypothetical protein